MKTISKSIGALAFALTAMLLPACDLLDKADDVSFNATLDEDIAVAKPNEGTNVALSETIALDARDQNSDINKYAKKITGFKIHKLSYKITSYDGVAGCTFTGEISFGDVSTSSPTVAAVITNLNLQEAYTSGEEFDIELDPADVKAVQSLLKSDKAVNIYITGTLSQTPVYFTVKVILDVNVEADAL